MNDVRSIQFLFYCNTKLTILILFIALAIVVSFYCSLLESAFLSLTPAYVRHYQTLHPKNGLKLVELKNDVDRPLAAVLSLNTVAHTLGATGAGAQAIVVFGNEWIGLFSGLLTFAILILSEVIPKTLGALLLASFNGFCDSFTVHFDYSHLSPRLGFCPSE